MHNVLVPFRFFCQVLLWLRLNHNRDLVKDVQKRREEGDVQSWPRTPLR